VTAATPSFTRKRIERSGTPIALAFAFDESPRVPEHVVTVAAWTAEALQVLRDLHQHFASLEPRRSLPVESLRGRLEVSDADNLRLDRSLGVWSRSSTILWTGCPPADASQRIVNAVLGWLIDDLPSGDASSRDLMQSLKRLAREGRLIHVMQRRAQVFAWEQTRSGTAVGAASNREGYADLADFVARRLEGEEVLPDLGPLRRIASGELDANQAELITEPVPAGSTLFSLVVRARVLSFPGRPTPIIVLELSRRIWTHALKRAGVRRLSAYALPAGTHTALRFTLCRRRSPSTLGSSYVYQPGDDFAPIARAYGLQLDMTGEEIAEGGHRRHACRLLVVHKHGVGERVEAKQGVPDLDKVAAYRRIETLLAPHGFQPWHGFVENQTATRSIKDRNQKWRNRDEDEIHREEFEKWQERAKGDIAACYAGVHQIVVAYHRSSLGDAERARALLDKILGDRVSVELIPIPHDVHGPRSALPEPESKSHRSRDYAELRMQAWKPFVDEVQRYQAETGLSLDGVLVIAPEWYGVGPAHDDRVNKRAGRITLARELRVPVQYLRPEREEGQQFRQNQDPSELFETRLMMAWLDLAWKSIGRVRTGELVDVAARIYGSGEAAEPPAVLPPDRVLGVGILRRNSTRSDNQKSFVPFAIELDIERGSCSARFARERGPGLEITPLVSLPDVLVELAASGPIQLVTDKSGRREQLRERSQHFFHEVITDFCQRSERPLVLIDAVSCREVWPWVTDTKLDGENVVIAGHPHAEADWGDVRIVRIRTQNVPKILFDGYFEGVCSGTGEVVNYDAPKWADAQLFKVTDSQANVYLSFGGLLRTTRILGSSCYRQIDGLRRNVGTPTTYRREPIERFTGAWSTPSGVEFTVVRTAQGEQPEQVAQLVEWLRTLYEHVGDWTTKPAPLHFEGALKEYVADYDVDEDVEDEGDNSD
jgi:hypothetical protein